MEEIFSRVELGKVGELISEHDKRKSMLIPMLHRIQENLGYLSREALERLSQEIVLPLAEIYSVASFYRQFHFSPRGKTLVKVCTGTACHVRGASEVLESLKEHFKVGVGETTKDLSMTLETVGCVGCCGLAPVVALNEEVIGEIGYEEVNQFIDKIEET